MARLQVLFSQPVHGAWRLEQVVCIFHSSSWPGCHQAAALGVFLSPPFCMLGSRETPAGPSLTAYPFSLSFPPSLSLSFFRELKRKGHKKLVEGVRKSSKWPPLQSENTGEGEPVHVWFCLAWVLISKWWWPSHEVHLANAFDFFFFSTIYGIW